MFLQAPYSILRTQSGQSCFRKAYTSHLKLSQWHLISIYRILFSISFDCFAVLCAKCASHFRDLEFWRQGNDTVHGGTQSLLLDLFDLKSMAPSADRNAGVGMEQQARYSIEEVAVHSSANDAWIVVDGEVYDVTEFLQTHPGGPEVILEHIQEKDVGQLMRGMTDASDHAHSGAAFGILNDYHIGSLNDKPCAVSTAMLMAKRVDSKNSTYTVDLNKPLVFQVGHLGDRYQEWVHQPIVQKESPRFFANEFMESLTRTLWWVVPVIWIPVVCWCQVIAIRRGFPVNQLLTTMPLGILIWSLVEYTLHRFLFHVKTKSYWGNTLHYLLHGCHHKHPMDGYRLVFPPTFAAMFAVPLYGVLALFFSSSWSPSVFGFGLLGYTMYDVTHYFLHHGTPMIDAARNLKRYHLNHHFKMQEDGYGITSPLWDFVFGTLPAKLKFDSNMLQ